MKTIRVIIILLLSLGLFPLAVSARTIEVKLSQCPKPLLENVRNRVANATANDVVILNFDKAGKYEFDGSISIKCNTIIKGVGSKNTRVIVKEGFSGGKSTMKGDTFFAVYGTPSRKVKVEVRDIRFELASHKGTLWETAPKHIIKICDGDGIVVDNATFLSTDAVITHVDLRDCSNVVVQNCLFENYNNCREGGCLWSRGGQNNIVVRNNVFWKYGNDEAFGCWGGVVKDADVAIKNVTVEGNKFFYENKTKSKNNISIDVLITFAHHGDERVKHKCAIDNIVFRNNTLTNNAPSKRNFLLNFDDMATLGKIEVYENTIKNNSRCQVSDGYMTDISINTGVKNKGEIFISDNNVYNEAEILWDGKHSGYTFIGVKNGNVQVSNNYVQSDYPVAFVWCHGGNTLLNLNNNTASMLYNTVILNSSTKLEKVVINAEGNEFSGDTRFYCNNIDELELNFTNNIFNSSNDHFFVQEGAPKTSVVFDGNTINSLSGKGIMFANYSGKPYKFTKLQVTNNIFNGITKKSIGDSFNKNVTNKIIQNNIYR